MRRIGALAGAAALWLGAWTSPVWAQATVGVPGCSDDVPVQAGRDTITYQSRGRAIRAHLYSPRGRPNGRGLVLLHGGTGWEMNSILFDAHAIQLASRGYWVILPAYFDAARPDAERRTVTGRAWTQAAIDAAAHVAGQAGVDPARISFWGYSRGGGVAVSAGLLPEAPVSAVIGVATGGGLGAERPATNRPVLLLHARSDEAVSPRATRSLADELGRASVPVTIEELDFDGHQYDLGTWCSVMARTRSFLEGLGDAAA